MTAFCPLGPPLRMIRFAPSTDAHCVLMHFRTKLQSPPPSSSPAAAASCRVDPTLLDPSLSLSLPLRVLWIGLEKWTLCWGKLCHSMKLALGTVNTMTNWSFNELWEPIFPKVHKWEDSKTSEKQHSQNPSTLKVKAVINDDIRILDFKFRLRVVLVKVLLFSCSTVLPSETIVAFSEPFVTLKVIVLQCQPGPKRAA